jgi:hypothetical protein
MVLRNRAGWVPAFAENGRMLGAASRVHWDGFLVHACGARSLGGVQGW